MSGTDIQFRKDTGANWHSNNPILALAEVGVEIDSIPVKIKLGDGTHNWDDLPYFSGVNRFHLDSASTSIEDTDEIIIWDDSVGDYRTITIANLFATVQIPNMLEVSEPTAPEIGRIWVDFNTNQLKVWNGSLWKTADLG